MRFRLQFSARLWRIGAVAASASVLCAGALAQSSAKELFVGLDGEATPLSSNGPAKPLKPKVLGLQTTIYQLFPDGGTKAVSPNTVFAGGDRIRLGFNANRSGWLYVVNVGSSGRVTTLFPRLPTDNNRIQPGLVYQIPQQTGKSIKFDATPGQELLIVVLAESRLSDFEYGGQTITIEDASRNTAGSNSASSGEPPRPQVLAMASSGGGSTAKDLFVEDDGVFVTAVHRPESESASGRKPLVQTLKLVHR